MITMLRRIPAFVIIVLLLGCGDAPPPPPEPEAAPAAQEQPAASEPAPEQLEFWDRLVAHCGNAYPGVVDDFTPYYASSAEYETIIAHFRECEDERIHIAMHMDDDRSRNWILTKVGGTIRLKHDHRHEDGTEEEITQYGGDAPRPGLPHRQIFMADEHTARILPDRWDNFWFMDFMDEDTFAYGVHWPEHGNSIRIHFDLSTPVEAPPDPWGY
jgi:hypothetical protein